MIITINTKSNLFLESVKTVSSSPCTAVTVLVNFVNHHRSSTENAQNELWNTKVPNYMAIFRYKVIRC